MFSKPNTQKERGQAIILVAISLVGLIAMVGLMIDGGALFLESSRLKRAIDSAAVAAALQFRVEANLSITENTPGLYEAANEFILLNEGETYQIETFICDKSRAGDVDYEHDDLCTESASSFQKKLVRVRGTKDLEFNFLPVIGIESTTITADSVGEAATVDLVLVIDSSFSMTDQTAGDRDPFVCNAANNCQPFRDVKDVAEKFAEKLLFDYGDRIAVITFDTTAHTHGSWLGDATTATNVIHNLKVIEPPDCYHDPVPGLSTPRYGPCLERIAGGFNQGCINHSEFGDWTSCTSSNVGGGLNQANVQFQQDFRDDSLWIVVLLVGGPANQITPNPARGWDYGYCSPNFQDSPFCRDDQASVRHADGDVEYDGDDYARDAADLLVGTEGTGAIIYTIGLGEKVTNDIRHRTGDTDGDGVDDYDPDIAEQMLIYIATEAGTPDQGIYYLAADSSDSARLEEIFAEIAENIATKISQ